MELILITSNEHKYREMSQKLAQIGVDLKQLSQSYPEIQADTIEDVARHSISLLVPIISGNFIMEDAGLEISALDGFPGPYSSYCFQTIGNTGILKLMQGIEDRSARFVSVIGLYLDGSMQLFRGVCEGSISLKASGDHGFGFDPVFIPKGEELTFAELDLPVKNKLSHRGLATQQMMDFLQRD